MSLSLYLSMYLSSYIIPRKISTSNFFFLSYVPSLPPSYTPSPPFPKYPHLFLFHSLSSLINASFPQRNHRPLYHGIEVLDWDSEKKCGIRIFNILHLPNSSHHFLLLVHTPYCLCSAFHLFICLFINVCLSKVAAHHRSDSTTQPLPPPTRSIRPPPSPRS